MPRHDPIGIIQQLHTAHSKSIYAQKNRIAEAGGSAFYDFSRIQEWNNNGSGLVHERIVQANEQTPSGRCSKTFDTEATQSFRWETARPDQVEVSVAGVNCEFTQ